MTKQTWKITPESILGKCSVALIVAMPILFVIGTSFRSTLYQTIPAGRTILADISVRPILAITMLMGMAAGIFGFITGLLAIIKQKERAISVYIATVIGALFVLFIVGEVLFPH